MSGCLPDPANIWVEAGLTSIRFAVSPLLPSTSVYWMVVDEQEGACGTVCSKSILSFDGFDSALAFQTSQTYACATQGTKSAAGGNVMADTLGIPCLVDVNHAAGMKVLAAGVLGASDLEIEVSGNALTDSRPSTQTPAAILNSALLPQSCD
eukprot:scaffold195692_cov36-Prasinocladus_malaysianus.AAC.1